MTSADLRNLILAAMAGTILFVFGYILGAEHVFPSVECFFGIDAPGLSCF